MIPPLGIILLCICIISLILYCLFIIMVIKHRKEHPFNSSFFHISIFLGVGDCLELLLLYIHKAVIWGISGKWTELVTSYGDWVPVMVLSSIYYFTWWQHLAVTLLAGNRLIAIAYPTKIQRIFTTKTTGMLMACVAVLAGMATVDMATSGLRYQYLVENRTDAATIGWYSKESQKKTLHRMAAFVSLLALVSATFYMITFILLYIRHKKNQQQVNGSSIISNKADLKMAIVGFCTFVVQMLYAIFFVMASFASVEYLQKILVIRFIIGDIFSWMNPYLILIMSSKARETFLEMYGLKKPKIVVQPTPLQLQQVKHGHHNTPTRVVGQPRASRPQPVKQAWPSHD